MNDQTPTQQDDGYADELDLFVSQVAEDTVEEIGVKRRARFRLWLILFVLIGIIFVVLGFIYDPANLTGGGDDDATSPPSSNNIVAESEAWLDDAQETAIAYQAQLSAEAIDCAAVRTEAVFRVPDLPEAVSNETTGPQMDEPAALMRGVFQSLGSVADQMAGFCQNADSLSSDDLPPNRMSLAVEQALAQIETARLALADVEPDA